MARCRRSRARTTISRVGETLEDTLQNVQVFRVGEIAIDVFIIGETEGGFAGLQTKVVET